MTDIELAEFKQRIYAPYIEAWNVMKWMRDTEPKDDKFWQEFTLKALNFSKQYGDSEIAQSISRVILDAGSEYQRIIKG